MSTETAITLLASAARGAGAGVSATLTLATGDNCARLVLYVTAVSGTTKFLACTIDTSSDGVFWTTLHTFTAATAAGTQAVTVAGCKAYLRASYTVSGTGTPVITFAIAGTSLRSYASPSDLARLGVASTVTSDVSGTDIAEALISQSDAADGYLDPILTLPLTAWTDALRSAVCKLAAWDVLTVAVGFSPDDAANQVWSKRRDEAIEWFRDVAASRIGHGCFGTTPSTPSNELGIEVYTETQRGW